MRFLLDVNALVALGFLQHEFHQRTAKWLETLARDAAPEFLTCSITELGFLRVLAQAPQYGLTLAHARSLLLNLKSQATSNFRFVRDGHDVSHLPHWVRTSKQVTDGHLWALARANNAELATLDRKIPGAFIIPV